MVGKRFGILRERDWQNKIRIGAFFFFQIVLLVIGIYWLKRPYYSYSCQGEELVTNGAIFFADFIDGLQNGYYIDDTMVTDEIKNDSDLSLYIATPEIDFHKGSYEVKIYYSSQEKINTYTVSSKYNTRDIRIGNVSKGVNGPEGIHVFNFETSLDVEDYSVKVNYCNSNYIFINRIDINETNDWRYKTFVGIVFVIAMMNLAFVAWYKRWKIIRKEYISLIIIVGAIAILASLPVLYRGIYWGHDTSVHVARIEGIKEALKEGIFPVRMQNFFFNGYGYPISIYYGDLLLYFPAVLRLLGFDVQTCFSVYIIAVNFFTGFATYFATSRIFKNKLYGMIAAFVYVLAPYRLSCLYLRGAIGEASAMIFYPIIIYGLYGIFVGDDENDSSIDWLWLSIGFSGLIYSHMISTIIMGIFTFIICVVFIKKTFTKDCFMKLCKAVGLAVLLCVEFLVPLMDYLGEDIKLNAVERNGMFQGHGAYLSQLFAIIPHGYGRAYSDTKMLESEVEMSYSIGAVFLLVLLLYLLRLVNHRRKEDNITKLGKTMFGVAVLALYMSSVLFPWDVIEQMGQVFVTITKTIQFPWRILGIASVALTFLMVCTLAEMKAFKSKELRYVLGSIIFLGTLWSSGYWMSDFMNNTDQSLVRYTYEVGDQAVGQGEYLPENVDYDVFNDVTLWHDENIIINSMERTNSRIVIDCKNITDREQYIDVPFLYYKDYVANNIDNKEVLQTVVGRGKRVRVAIPEGFDGRFEVSFESPWYWRVCEIISFGTFIVVGIYACQRWKNRNECGKIK